ncbi:MAG: lysine--tRNA ligase [Patescibacteria group bacterium]
MTTLLEIRNARLEKLKMLADAGINPYPISSRKSSDISLVLKKFDSLVASKKKVTLAGRLMALRGQGAIMFFDLSDGTGKIQGTLKSDETKDFELFSKVLDIGDIVEVSGHFFITKRGEKTIASLTVRMLAKSLRPLPEKWHGLQDMEERLRRRYLDLLADETKKRFLTRSRIVTAVRAFLEKKGFVEVETPMLQHVAGGASATPFKTHHNFLDIPLYLRIAPEIYLKELLVGGVPKVYEIGRNFRNEGIDVTHNPEFTTVEFYESFADAKKFRKLVEALTQTLVKKIVGTDKIIYSGNEIDFGKKFSTIKYFDLLEQYAHFNPAKASEAEIEAKAKEYGVTKGAGDSREKLLDGIYKKACRPHLIQPIFVIDYPTPSLPLAKRLPKKDFVDAFQLVVGGLELVKAFSELNDPIDQAQRFFLEEQNKKAGDKEAQSMDSEFIEAIEYGLPPAGGAGFSIDRFTMLLTDSKNIREVILFPTLRPRS